MAKKQYQIDANDEVALKEDFTLTDGALPSGGYVMSLFSSENTSLNSVISDACPYATVTKVTGETLEAGKNNYIASTGTFTLPDCAANSSADVVIITDCRSAAYALTINPPSGTTAAWCKGQSDLTYASGKVYQRVYNIIRDPTLSTQRIITVYDKELTVS